MTPTLIKSALAAVILAGSATLATAAVDNIFVDGSQKNGGYIDIDLVRTTVDGFIEIRELNGGEPGRLLATESVHAGANDNMRVGLSQRPHQEVVLMLFSADNQLLDSVDVDVDR